MLKFFFFHEGADDDAVTDSLLDEETTYYNDADHEAVNGDVWAMFVLNDVALCDFAVPDDGIVEKVLGSNTITNMKLCKLLPVLTYRF